MRPASPPSWWLPEPVLPENKTGARVADDHQAAQSIGIPLSRIWVIVWSVAGAWPWWPA
jgi:hypothetical protein